MFILVVNFTRFTFVSNVAVEAIENHSLTSRKSFRTSSMSTKIRTILTGIRSNVDNVIFVIESSSFLQLSDTFEGSRTWVLTFGIFKYSRT